ncbi:MAG: dihydroxyacetone kinase subunit DhaK [Caldilineaceae bacterium]
MDVTAAPFAGRPGDCAGQQHGSGTPLSELYAVYRKVDELCRARAITIVRNLIGPYITSLEMQGCSVTLLKADDEMLRLWDAPVNTPALRWGA